MYQGRTLQDVLTTAEHQAMTKQDFIASTDQLTMGTAGGEIALAVGEHGAYRVTEHTHGQIAERLGIPKPYYNRLRHSQPGLLFENVNTLFREEPENRMVRTLAGKARAFVSDRFANGLDNYDVAQVALPMMHALNEDNDLGLRMESCEITERRMYLKFVTPRVKADVRVGDEVQQGFVLRNSEIGLGALELCPMVWRLICLNGCTSGKALRKHHVGRKHDVEEWTSNQTRALEDAATLSKLRDAIIACMDGTFFHAAVSKMQAATEAEVSAPVETVQVLANRHDLANDEAQGVLNHFLHGRDFTQYGLMNAVTAFAQDESLTYDRASELEMLGGRVLDLAPTEWRQLALAA